jgi:hypothetical protein
MGIAGADPDIPIEEILGREPPADSVWDVGEGADAQARDIPGWASWTEALVLQWMEENVAPEIEGIAPKTYIALCAMVRMIVALRNKTWPQLEGS